MLRETRGKLMKQNKTDMKPNVCSAVSIKPWLRQQCTWALELNRADPMLNLVDEEILT